MNRKEKIITFCIILLFSCMVFSNFLTMHYATDTYNIINVGYKNYAIKWPLKDGRLFMFMVTMIAYYLNLNIKIWVIVSLFSSLIISSVTVIKLENIILKLIEKDTNTIQHIIIAGISYCIIFNFINFFLFSLIHFTSLYCRLGLLIRSSKCLFLFNLIWFFCFII